MNNEVNSTENVTFSKPQPQKGKNDFRNLIYALLTTGLIAAVGYIWWSKKNETEINKKQEQQIAAGITKVEDVQESYDAALVRLDSIVNLNTSLNATITNKDGNIEKLKGEITTLMSKTNKTDAEKAMLRNKIKALQNEIDNYQGQVAELQKQNQALTEENTTVKTERDQVIAEKTQLKNDLDKTTTEKKQLEDKVDVGATLVANNFNIAGINERRNGKEKETSTAKRVDKLRIGFDLDANRIAQSGTKKIYVSITAPDGTAVTVEALGSGKMQTREEGEKFYTTTLDVDYKQGEKKYINFDWKQNSDFQRGDYKVEVYQNGFKIGEGKVHLAKGGLFG